MEGDTGLSRRTSGDTACPANPDSAYTGEEMAGDIADLLDHLRVRPVIVAGHSMGGRVAGYFAALYPELVSAAAILDKSASASVQGKRLSAQAPVDPVTGRWPLPFSTLSEARIYIERNMDSELSVQYFMNSLHETAERGAYAFQSAGDGIEHRQ